MANHPTSRDISDPIKELRQIYGDNLESAVGSLARSYATARGLGARDAETTRLYEVAQRAITRYRTHLERQPAISGKKKN